MGQIFYNMGFLASTEVVDCSTSDLIGEYVGQTGPKTRKLLQRALGKVLFIDEAYHLSESRFGREAVIELMNVLTKDTYHNKIVVILAGYEDDIDNLLAMNDSFSSRFPETLNFVHLTPMHAYQLFIRYLQEKKLSTSALQPQGELLDLFRRLATIPGWANARDIQALAKSISRTVMKSSAFSTPTITDEVIHEELGRMIDERQRRAKYAVSNTLGRPIRSKLSFADRPEMQNQRQPTQKLAQRSAVLSRPKSQAEAKGNGLETSSQLHTEAGDTLRTSAQSASSDEHREPDVSDADWARLQRSKTQARKRGATVSKIRYELPQLTWEVRRLEKAFAEARKDSAEGDAIMIMLENARHLLQGKEAVLAEAKSEEEKEAAIIEKLVESGVCCYGYQWLKEENGYRCAGGSHFKTDEEIFEEYNM